MAVKPIHPIGDKRTLAIIFTNFSGNDGRGFGERGRHTVETGGVFAIIVIVDVPGRTDIVRRIRRPILGPLRQCIGVFNASEKNDVAGGRIAFGSANRVDQLLKTSRLVTAQCLGRPATVHLRPMYDIYRATVFPALPGSIIVGVVVRIRLIEEFKYYTEVIFECCRYVCPEV